MIALPDFVARHCAKFKLCNGCKLNCVAPASQLIEKFDEWILDRIKLIENYEYDPENRTKQASKESPKRTGTG